MINPNENDLKRDEPVPAQQFQPSEEAIGSTGPFFRFHFSGRCSNRRGKNRRTLCETALSGSRKWTWKATQNRSASAGERGLVERWRSLLSRIWWCRLQVRNAEQVFEANRL